MKTNFTVIVVYAHKFAHVATLPLQFAVRHIPNPRKKKTVKLMVGVVIMLSGAAMAKYPWHLVNHIVWDALAYGLHGYGALPWVKVMCHKFDLENLEQSEVSQLREEIEILRREINKGKSE